MRVALIALLLTIGSQAGAENVLYCSTAPNLATVFVNEDGKWRTSNFFEELFTVKEVGNFSSVEIADAKFSCRRPYEFERGAITCQKNQDMYLITMKGPKNSYSFSVLFSPIHIRPRLTHALRMSVHVKTFKEVCFTINTHQTPATAFATPAKML